MEQIHIIISCIVVLLMVEKWVKKVRNVYVGDDEMLVGPTCLPTRGSVQSSTYQ